MKKTLLLTALAAALALSPQGCKSKMEKCTDACDRVGEKETSRCRAADDKGCLATAQQMKGSCMRLCNTAYGSKTSAWGSGPSHEGKKPAVGRVPAEQAGCEEGKAEACADLGGRYLLGRGVKKDEPRAAKLFEKACEAGSAFGCETLGKMMRDGRGVARNEKRAAALLAKACDGGAAGACTSVGLAALKAKDHKRAVGMLTKACDAKDKIGCTALGALYLHGNGVKKNRAKARTLLGKACNLGSQKACKKLASLG